MRARYACYLRAQNPAPRDCCRNRLSRVHSRSHGCVRRRSITGINTEDSAAKKSGRPFTGRVACVHHRTRAALVEGTRTSQTASRRDTMRGPGSRPRRSTVRTARPWRPGSVGMRAMPYVKCRDSDSDIGSGYSSGVDLPWTHTGVLGARPRWTAGGGEAAVKPQPGSWFGLRPLLAFRSPRAINEKTALV
jgi:hypothetical protein